MPGIQIKTKISVQLLADLIMEYQFNNFGEKPNFISINDIDLHKLKNELWSTSNILIKDRPKDLKFMGIRVLECYNLERGEIILSK